MGGKQPCETIFLYGGTSNRTLFLFYICSQIGSHSNLTLLTKVSQVKIHKRDLT